MLRSRPIAVCLIPLLAGGCFASVMVTPGAAGLTARPRPPGCAVDFLRTRAPERPYDELAGLHAEGAGKNAVELQEAMRAKACEVGADAVVITRDFVPQTKVTTSVMTGTAVKYREFPAQAAPLPKP